MVSRRQRGAVTSPNGRNAVANKTHENLRIWLIAACALTAALAVPVTSAVAEGGSGGSQPKEQQAGSRTGNDFSGRVVRRHVRSGAVVKIRARSLEAAAKSASGRTRTLTIRVRRDGVRRWKTVERLTGLSKKTATLRWRTKRPGRYQVRAVVSGSGKPQVESLGRFNVYRAAHASWYGGGGTTACGQRLTDSTMGVAHKTLPCGTKVLFRYGNRTAVARVIDRGPFIAGREWDLTVALKRAIGFGDVGEVLTTR